MAHSYLIQLGDLSKAAPAAGELWSYGAGVQLLKFLKLCVTMQQIT
jgi:hypothetical protein